MKEKRMRERRVNFDSAQSFPFQEASGNIVFEDRRRRADRRLNSIWMELITAAPGDIPRPWK